jgi:hypothetical protein
VDRYVGRYIHGRTDRWMNMKGSEDDATHCVKLFIFYPSSTCYKDHNFSEVYSTVVFR